MMTTTYKCDRCCAESVGKDDIGLERVEIRVGQYSGYTFGRHSADWCKKCRVELCISHHDLDKTVTPQNPPPTLEDIVREICREEIGDAR